jgi:hypothetical protein
MPNDKEKDELLTTPLEDAQRTTPYRTPPASGETPPDLPDGSLRALRQRYDILAEVGRGGMGIVYKARDRETGDVVALKVLRPEIAARPEVIERFKSELLLARKITHKNVCRTYELLRFGDTVVIAMEYVEGESLRSLLSRVEGLAIRQGLKILRQIISGLAEAHAQGVVHRDLKPENILITKDGGVKVMDFGIARSIEAEATQTSSIVGTPAYMSPEQAEGKPTDARTDIYALGLILYEIFTGRLPFHADTPVGLVHKQIYETPPPARSVDPYLPVFLERAIEKCLEKNPKKRFQSVGELEAALSEEAPPEVAPEAAPVPRKELGVWRRWDWVLLVLGVIGAWYFLKFRDVVFPASKMPLEIDAIAAQREAENLAIRLGRPFPPTSKSQLEYKAERYANRFYATLLGRAGPQDPFQALTRVELPLYWKVSFESEYDPGLSGGAPERYVLVDRRGKIEEFVHPFLFSPALPNYTPPPIERRREIARATVEQVCGAIPPNLTRVETSGADWGASYTSVWKPLLPLGSSPWAEVALWTEKPVTVKCYSQNEIQSSAAGIPMRALKGLQIFFGIAMLALLLTPMAYFVMGQCHRSPIFWKRLIPAVALGIAGVWLLTPAFLGTAPSLPILVVGGVGLSGLFLVALVAVENMLTRRTPGWIATYVLLLRAEFLEPAVGLAIVRGALAGWILAALETICVYIFLRTTTSRGKFHQFFSSFIDPVAVASAATSFSPALFVVSSALFDGVTIALIALGAIWADKELQKLHKEPDLKGGRLGASILLLLAGASAVAVAVLALRLPFGQNLSDVELFVPALLGTVLTWLLLKYDVLTVLTAVATSILWTLNYPLLQVFRELGNGGQWAVFIGWGVLVTAAAAVAFRAELVRAVQRARAEMQ